MRAGYCTQSKIQRHNYYYRAGAATARLHYRTRVMHTDYRTDDTCATVHARHATTDRNTRAPYTWARPPTCTPCRPPDHQLISRIGRYATVPARAGYTWAHPPTCAPYTAVRFLTSARAPVVIIHPRVGSARVFRSVVACRTCTVAHVSSVQ